MALSLVTITWDETDIGQGGLSGSIKFAPNTTWTDTLGGTVIEPQPLTFPILDSAGQTTPLIANDSAGLLPAGSYYVITVQVSGLPPRTFNASIDFANGASQTLGSLNPLVTVPAQLSYLPLPSGTPSAGQVPEATGSGQLSAWATPSSAPVASVFGRTGAVTAQGGDYTAAQVGALALPSGTPAAGEIPLATGTGEASAWGQPSGGVVFARTYGATGNAKTFYTAAITATLTALTASALVPGWTGFTPGDVGKVVLVQGAGAAGAVLQTTIAAYVSSTAVTLTAAASTTVTGANALYGTDDTAAVQAAINATPFAGVCILDDAGGNDGYLISSTLNFYGADLTNPVPIRLAGLSTTTANGVTLYAAPGVGAAPVLNVSTKYTVSSAASQFAGGDLDGISVDCTYSPASVGIYYDRVAQIRETRCRTRAGACGRVIGWADDITFSLPRAYNHTDSYWKWFHTYSTSAPWDTANAGNTVGGGGSTYSDPVTFQLIFPLNYITSSALAGGKANTFYEIRAGEDFEIIGGHSLRTPGVNSYITNGMNVDFSWDAGIHQLDLVMDAHEFDGLWDGTGTGGPFLGSGAAIALNNAQVARFGSLMWVGPYSALDNAEMWALKLTNCTDVVVAPGGHWSGRGVLLDGVNADIVIKGQFPQPLSDPVISSHAAGTLDSSMNGLSLPQASIAVDNMAGSIPATGSISVATTAAGPSVIPYTGFGVVGSVTTFTGCTGGGGTLATGGIVVLKTLTNSVIDANFDGTLADNAETLAAAISGASKPQRTPAQFVGNGSAPALAIGRAMDTKTWLFQMDTSSTGTLQLRNAENVTKLSISDAGVLTPGTAIALTAGGTGQTTAQAAMNALAAAVTSGSYLRGNGTNVQMSAIQAADLPAGTTLAQGALQLDGTASDIQPTGPRAAGAVGKAADAGHVHFSSGQFLCAPSQYAPSGNEALATTSATLGAVTGAASTVAAGSNGGEISQVATWSSPSAGVLAVANGTVFPAAGGTFTAATSSTTATCTYTGVSGNTLTGCAYVSGSATGTVSTGGAVTLTSAAASTGSFTAPASGSVLVTVSLVAKGTGNDIFAFALAAHGTVTPVVGNVITGEQSSVGNGPPLSMPFYITGLTPGNSYNLDLLSAISAAGTLTVQAFGQTSTTPTGNFGGPVVMTVQAI